MCGDKTSWKPAKSKRHVTVGLNLARPVACSTTSGSAGVPASERFPDKHEWNDGRVTDLVRAAIRDMAAPLAVGLLHQVHPEGGHRQIPGAAEEAQDAADVGLGLGVGGMQPQRATAAEPAL